MILNLKSYVIIFFRAFLKGFRYSIYRNRWYLLMFFFFRLFVYLPLLFIIKFFKILPSLRHPDSPWSHVLEFNTYQTTWFKLFFSRELLMFLFFFFFFEAFYKFLILFLIFYIVSHSFFILIFSYYSYEQWINILVEIPLKKKKFKYVNPYVNWDQEFPAECTQNTFFEVIRKLQFETIARSVVLNASPKEWLIYKRKYNDTLTFLTQGSFKFFFGLFYISFFILFWDRSFFPALLRGFVELATSLLLRLVPIIEFGLRAYAFYRALRYYIIPYYLKQIKPFFFKFIRSAEFREAFKKDLTIKSKSLFKKLFKRDIPRIFKTSYLRIYWSSSSVKSIFRRIYRVIYRRIYWNIFRGIFCIIYRRLSLNSFRRLYRIIYWRIYVRSYRIISWKISKRMRVNNIIHSLKTVLNLILEAVASIYFFFWYLLGRQFYYFYKILRSFYLRLRFLRSISYLVLNIKIFLVIFKTYAEALLELFQDVFEIILKNITFFINYSLDLLKIFILAFFKGFIYQCLRMFKIPFFYRFFSKDLKIIILWSLNYLEFLKIKYLYKLNEIWLVKLFLRGVLFNELKIHLKYYLYTIWYYICYVVFLVPCLLTNKFGFTTLLKLEIQLVFINFEEKLINLWLFLKFKSKLFIFNQFTYKFELWLIRLDYRLLSLLSRLIKFNDKFYRIKKLKK